MVRFSLLLGLAGFVSVCIASPSRQSESFGRVVAAGDGHLFITDSGGFKNPGSVHVYVRGEDGKWTLKHSLHGPNAHVGDGFGGSIAYRNGILAVSDPSNIFLFEYMKETGDFVQIQQLKITRAPYGALTLDDDWLAVTVAQTGENPAQVHLFQQSPAGEWSRKATIESPKDTTESMFGVSLSMNQKRLLIGAPGDCAAYLYETQNDAWELSTTFPCDGLSENSEYGLALSLQGNYAAVGAPMHNGAGAVALWHLETEWKEIQIFSPEDQDRVLHFGQQVHIRDDQVVVGVPLAGEVRMYSVQENTYTPLRSSQSRFGYATLVNESTVAVGIPFAAYGEGSVELFELKNGTWEITQELYVDEHMSSISEAECDGDQAAGFECGLMDLIAFLPNRDMEMNRGVRLNDVWGWTDPETGVEYALIGHMEGTVFVDLQDPFAPTYLGTLPRTQGSPASTWRDIKVYKNHAFIVADNAGKHGMQIFDLTQLRERKDTPMEFQATARYDQIHSVHNIVINEETGFAYAVGSSRGGETCGGGLHMIDIRQPQSPAFAGCFADETTGRRETGYSHDAQCVIYNGPDTRYVGREICFSANETAISISDVTEKATPLAIGTASYPNASYVHQGWLSEDHTYFYQNDELDELAGKVEKTRTLIWDVRNLSDPVMIREFYGPTSATDHNLYVHGNLMYQTNNASGLRMIDVSNPEQPVEIGYFDTTPYGTDEAGFNGTWSSYPYFESGIIVVTSRREGVFLLRKQPVDI